MAQEAGAGAGAGVAGGPPGTAAVCAELTFVVPAGLVAITCERSVEPWSAVTTTYVFAIPPVAWQLLPAESQRSQAYERLTRNLLAHDPSLVVSVCPTLAVPATVGAPVLVGPVPWPVICAVAFEVLTPILPPLPSKALTCRRIVKPTSPDCST